MRGGGAGRGEGGWRRTKKEGAEKKVAREGGRERILDIVPLLKNGDRLVIYTAADARSALKISRAQWYLLPTVFCIFHVSFSPSLSLSLSLYLSIYLVPHPRFFYAHLICPAPPRRASFVPGLFPSISRDFSPIFSFFVAFSTERERKRLPSTHLSPVVSLSVVPAATFAVRRFIRGRLSRNERVAPAGWRIFGTRQPSAALSSVNWRSRPFRRLIAVGAGFAPRAPIWSRASSLAQSAIADRDSFWFVLWN